MIKNKKHPAAKDRVSANQNSENIIRYRCNKFFNPYAMALWFKNSINEIKMQYPQKQPAAPPDGKCRIPRTSQKR
jgi:hypothetical protein